MVSWDSWDGPGQEKAVYFVLGQPVRCCRADYQGSKVEITVTPAFDWGTASEILMDVVKWFSNKGEPLWTEEQVSVEGLKASYKNEESFIAYHDNTPIGCMFLLESDPVCWPEVQDKSSIFIHKVAVLRNFKGTGVAQEMLQWASGYAQRQGKSWLRLACPADRPKLRQVYDSFGFMLGDRGRVGEFEDVARYELRVRE